MDRFEQIYTLHNELKRRRTALSRSELQDKLRISRASVTRLLAFCRDRLHMPIELDRQHGGSVYNASAKDAYELPASETHRRPACTRTGQHAAVVRANPHPTNGDQGAEAGALR